FKPAECARPDVLYDLDILFIINSDSYSFAKLEYWEGTLRDKKRNRIKHHKFHIDLKKIPKMVFLFNFVVSPAQNLIDIAKKCKDVRIIVANDDFYNQIKYKDKFKRIRKAKLPIMTLESPIDPALITSEKVKSRIIRIGKHSKAHGYKHNSEIIDVINDVNKNYSGIVQWDFMGVPGDYVDQMSDIPNVTVRREYSISVKDYLASIDIFLFFISWGRAEPWARVVAEAMMAGCPILATDRAGNRDQVYHGLNGYLCKTKEEFAEKIKFLIKNPEMMEMMRNNNISCSQQFTQDKIIHRFFDFIGI
ncbi:MAG: glycosyltransferase, partial [Anaerolineales bacterium]|nr:glycosyltransferase [Anaerolineales bacterium]